MQIDFGIRYIHCIVQITRRSDVVASLPDLLNGVLFAGNVCHLSDGLLVFFQSHLKTLGEGQSWLGLHRDAQLLRQLLPVPENSGEERIIIYNYHGNMYILVLTITNVI